jgi:uncharacterized protein YuzE
MDNDRVSLRSSARVTIAGVEFDNNFYDREVDVLYLHVGDPKDPVDWGTTDEGDGTSYSPDGGLIGMTILNARARLEEDGKIELTLPERKIVVRDLGDALT